MIYTKITKQTKDIRCPICRELIPCTNWHEWSMTKEEKEMNQREGKLNIGLTEYQEAQWLSAIKLYGADIMTKSLLSIAQKEVLLNTVQS